MPNYKYAEQSEYIPVCGLKVYPTRDIDAATKKVIMNYYEVRATTTNTVLMQFRTPYRLPPELEQKALIEIIRPYAKILVTAYHANQCENTGAVLRNSRKG